MKPSLGLFLALLSCVMLPALEAITQKRVRAIAGSATLFYLPEANIVAGPMLGDRARRDRDPALPAIVYNYGKSWV
ncbi:MAG TPA: hypothetical protein VMP38_11840 [Candidatus Acidoferrum sp.]|nr:hypothetical protein [Candidatus Acidoferrum sp.]